MSGLDVYYPMLYTTLFMWSVEVFGWEVFMNAAMEDAGRSHEQFLLPFACLSRERVAEIVRGYVRISA